MVRRALALLAACAAAPAAALSSRRSRLALRLTGGCGDENENSTPFGVSPEATSTLLSEGFPAGRLDGAPVGQRATGSTGAALRVRRGGAKRSGSARQASRIARELSDFIENPPDGCRVSVGKSLNVWVVTMTGPEGTIFAGEKYKLRVGFPPDYPMSPPSCYFLSPSPRHPHVYTNGDICLDLLGRGWRPNLTIAQLALSILSMISSGKSKGLPPDNHIHAASAPGKPQDGWMYHDDSC